MGKGRLEAFSDGVIAIIITIMVLELKVPHNASLEALRHLLPVFMSYVLSFIYVGIYWNNHHHLMHAAKSINGVIMWTNMHFLFWLSLIPFVTAWMGENHFAQWPVIFYGVVLIMNGISYNILVRTLISYHGEDSLLARAFGTDIKGRISVSIYAVAITTSFWYSWLGFALYTVVAAIWFIPDRRIENKMLNKEENYNG